MSDYDFEQRAITAEFHEELEKERYAEEMFERKANGIKEISFSGWKAQQAAKAAIFDQLKAAKQKA